MARNTSFTPYEEETVGAYDEEPGGPEFMAYGSTPSMALKDYSLPEDPMPLFLSEGAEESRQRGFGTGGERIPKRAVVWPRIFKAGVLAASAAAIAFAILSVGNPLALFADAKASLPAATADQSGATQTPNPQPAAAVQMASHGAPTPVLPSTAGVRASSPTARVTPTRDDIALALRAAQQSLVQTDPPPAAPEPVRRLDPDEVAALLKRARGLIEIGDIAPARLLLERAADAQEASAALLLAQTYDPAVLGTPDMRSITPDPAMARSWYQKAARFGSRDAQQRLSQLQN
jgi:TPR repeat protein